MMSSKENFDDLKASFDDDLEQLNQEFDQLLLKKLSLEHALEQDQLFDELAQEDEQIDKLAANRPDLDAAIKDQLERCQKKRLQKHTLQSLKKISRRAAAFLVVFLAGFTVLFFTVDAVNSTVICRAPASIEFSTSSFITEDGRSMTSPAAISSATLLSSSLISGIGFPFLYNIAFSSSSFA